MPLFLEITPLIFAQILFMDLHYFIFCLFISKDEKLGSIVIPCFEKGYIPKAS